MYYLVTSGSYSDYKVLGLVEGPDGAAINALIVAFEDWIDGGLRAVSYEHFQRCKKIVPSPIDGSLWTIGADYGEGACPHKAAYDAVWQWRNKQLDLLGIDSMDMDNRDDAVVRWLVREHGFRRVAYTECNTDDAQEAVAEAARDKRGELTNG